MPVGFSEGIVQLQDIVQFRSDRLFHGTVNIDWFQSDNQDFCEQAAEAFVFHGPDYHGVQQQDVGDFAWSLA